MAIAISPTPTGEFIVIGVNDKGKIIHHDYVEPCDLGLVAFHRICASMRDKGAVRVMFDIALDGGSILEIKESHNLD